MNPEIKQKWVDALRSGKYQQGRGFLRTHEDKYCCLGVLCDVMNVEWSKHEDWDLCYVAKVEGVDTGMAAVLPDEICEAAGLEERNPTVRPYISLAAMNDEGRTFEEIADVIGEQL